MLLTLLLLSTAVWMDIRSWRISNRLIISGLVLGFLVQIWEYGIRGMGIFIRNVSIPVILLYLLFLMRVLGAGDIKLFSVISSIWNLKITCITIAAGFLTAAVISLCKLIYQRNLFSRLIVFWEYAGRILATGKLETYPRESQGKQNFIHFSVAILIGFFIAYEVVY